MDLKSEFLISALIIGGVILVLIISKLIYRISQIKKQLKYIDIEIKRATEKKTLKHWRKEQRKVWLRILPFYRG